MPSVVQHRSSSAESVTSLALAYSSNNSAGNLLVYCNLGGAGTTSTVATDSNSNTITSNNVEAVANGNVRMDYVNSSNSGANTVTGHNTALAQLHLHIWEISGCATSSALDQSGGNSQSSNANLSVSTSAGTTVANDAVIGGWYDATTNDTFTAGTGFTPTEYTSNGAGNDAGFTEFMAVSSTGTQTATATLSASTSVCVGGVCAFKGAASTVSGWPIPTAGPSWAI